MKKIMTRNEYVELAQRAAAFIGEPAAGDPDHINDHAQIAERLNYFPARIVFEATKTGDDEWTFMADGASFPAPNEAIDGQISGTLAAMPGAYVVVTSSTVSDPISASPTGTELTLFDSGIGAYEAYATVQEIESLSRRIDISIDGDIPRLESRVQELFNIYTYVPDSSGNWVEDTNSLSPEYPLTNILYAHMLDNDGNINGDLNFANSTINDTGDLSSVNTADYSAIQIWAWKLRPEDAVSRIVELEAQVQDLTTRLEALENPTSPE